MPARPGTVPGFSAAAPASCAVRCAARTRFRAVPGTSGLDGQALATLGAAGVDHGAAATGLHADQKTMGTRAADLGRLISTFHFEILGNSGGIVLTCDCAPRRRNSPRSVPPACPSPRQTPSGACRARHRPRENRELSQKNPILATRWRFICQQHMKGRADPRQFVDKFLINYNWPPRQA